jgi:predicted  nucleic acid-binding Zn-ribbon protein
VKVSIDAAADATAKDQEIDQLQAELREAENREYDLQKRLEGAHKYWYTKWEAKRLKQIATEGWMKQLNQSNKLLEEEKSALQKQLVSVTEREQEALKKLDDLKERLCELGKEA